jgi:hypothetical protein
MKVNHLDVACDADGSSTVKVWCEVRTVEELVDVIEWLKLARRMMEGWGQICNDEVEDA